MKNLSYPAILLAILTSCQLFAQPFTLLKDINAIPVSASSNPSEFTNVNGVIAFTANDGVGGRQIWKSDGTSVGTRWFGYEYPDYYPYYNGGEPSNLIKSGSKLYFTAPGYGEDEFGKFGALYVSDLEGAYISYEPSDYTLGTYPDQLTDVNGTLYFVASGGFGVGFEVFKSVDGVTTLLKDIKQSNDFGTEECPPGPGCRNIQMPGGLRNVDGVLYFSAYDDENGYRTWTSDGTEAGTVPVEPSGGHIPVFPPFQRYHDTYVNNVLFFVIKKTGINEELWKWEGGEADAQFVKAFTINQNSIVGVRNLTNVNGTLFFTADEVGNGWELWKSNGTEAGTVLVKDIVEGTSSSEPFALSWIGRQLFFRANDGVHGDEIWKSDGTDEGTVMVQDIEPGVQGSNPYGNANNIIKNAFVEANGKVFTSIETTMYGVEPWVADLPDENVCPAPTSRLYVNVEASTSGSGSGWICAIKELREAVVIANGNAAITEIWVAKGTYKPTASTDRNASIIISRANLKILGGFAGTETSAAAASPTTNLTTVSGDIGVANNPADNSYHMLRVTGVPSSANGLQIDGFSFDKGNASDPNTTTSDNAYGGAAIFYSNAAATPILVSRSGFNGNTSSGSGGAVGVYQGNVRFDSCLFLGNSSANGGAAATYQAATKFSTCIFRQNSATSGSGGAVLIYIGSPAFTGTAFDRNTAAVSGGAVAQEQGNAVYKQCVFSGNSSATGGGIYQQTGGSSQLVNSTFFGNIASTNGGAVAFGAGGSTITARNSIFWKNKKSTLTNVAGADIIALAGSGAGTYNNNLLQANSSVPADNGGTISNNLRGVDPLFVNESSPYGADGWFIAFNDGLELKNTSPAKNVGNNTYAAGLSADIQGKPRVACTTVDLGAYENQACPALIAKNDLLVKDRISAITATVTNPFRNSLLIRYSGAEKAEVDITTFTGQKVWKGTAIQKGQTQVNTTAWPSGLYQVTIRTATEKPLVFKVVKAQ